MIRIVGALAAVGGLVVVGLQNPPERPVAAAKPVATIAATYTVGAQGRTRLTVSSNAKIAQVRFHRNRPRELRRHLQHGKTKIVLGKNVSRIKVRALGTHRLAASGWVKATRATPTPAPTTPAPTAPSTPGDLASPLTAADLRVVAATRVYFGHQSVGGNIMGAVPDVFTDFSVTAPPLTGTDTSRVGPFFADGSVGANGDPHSKVVDFAAKIRGGIGNRVDVALMKFCYVDIGASSNVNEVFRDYRDSLAQLQSEYPSVKFIAVTAPLTVGAPADNARREQYNALVRAEYPGRLFDLAAVESTTPDGTRITSLYSAYAADSEGHLNDQGSRLAAQELLKVIARVAG